ncbi:hypothetical protein KKC00_00315, partial [Patescibacteria group bacterium]|nr:hypothetical protein [Patescibacteria group bacterium]
DAKNWPEHEAYPQYAKIREIGKWFFKRYGRDGMEYAFQVMRCRAGGSESFLTYMWNGIGGWCS